MPQGGPWDESPHNHLVPFEERWKPIPGSPTDISKKLDRVIELLEQLAAH